MVRGRLLWLFLLSGILSFTLNQNAAAQTTDAAPRNAGRAAGNTAQSDAARPAGTSAAVPDSAPKNDTGTAEGSAQAPPPGAVPPLQIGPGDVLSISVYGVPELSQDVRVGNDGDVYLPLIGHVQIGGLTADQAQTVIENRLRDGDFVKSPHVSVFMKEYMNANVSLVGEVVRPGQYPILSTRRLLDMIAAAGGLTPRAGRTVVITHRDHPEQPIKLILPSDPVEAPKENIEILPGDTVLVAKAGVVYVVGEVVRPSGLIMDNNDTMTVMQAIALTGGTTSVARMNSARLIRKTEKGREEIPLQLKKILSAKGADVNLQADDIIFVPGSTGKKVAKRSLESVVALSTQLAIYRP